MTPTECSRMKAGSFSHDAPSLLGTRSSAESIRLPAMRSASRYDVDRGHGLQYVGASRAVFGIQHDVSGAAVDSEQDVGDPLAGYGTAAGLSPSIVPGKEGRLQVEAETPTVPAAALQGARIRNVLFYSWRPFDFVGVGEPLRDSDETPAFVDFSGGTDPQPLVGRLALDPVSQNEPAEPPRTTVCRVRGYGVEPGHGHFGACDLA